MCSEGGRLGLPEQKKGRDEGVLLCDGSGNEGEGGTVAVREGRSTRREVARQPEDRLTVLIICNTMPEEIFDLWTPPFRVALFPCFSKHTVKPPRR